MFKRVRIMGIMLFIIKRVMKMKGITIDQLISSIKIILDKEVYGVPMIEMIGMRICCYILLAVMLVRIFGD